MGVLKRGNPQSTVNLAEEVERGFDGLGKLPGRLDRYASAHERTLVNLSHVNKKLQLNRDSLNPYFQHLQKVERRMSTCGHYLGFRHYFTVDQVRLTAARFCKDHLLCPLCAVRRGSKMVETLVSKHAVVMAENPGLKMYMLTLTVKNGPDLAERHQHLKSSYQTLLDRRRDYKKKGWGLTEFAKIEGGVGSYEVTNRGNGWHPHLHLMIFTKQRINVAALKREWAEITGDSHVLRIDPARNPEDPAQDFLEVCKYALKFGDLTPEQNLDAYESLHGRRLIVSFGVFWGVKIPEQLTDDPLDGLPYFDMVYNFVAGSGYNLTGLTEVPLVDIECVDTESGEMSVVAVSVPPKLLQKPLPPFLFEYIQRKVDPRRSPALKPVRIITDPGNVNV